MNPRRTAPQPDPNAHADKTKLETSPAGRLCPKNMIRFPVTRALNKMMMG